MNKTINPIIEDLAIKDGILDCLQDPYDALKNGDPYSSVLPDMERFAKVIIEKCIEIADEYVRAGDNVPPTAKSKIGIEIREYFGIAKEEE